MAGASEADMPSGPKPITVCCWSPRKVGGIVLFAAPIVAASIVFLANTFGWEWPPFPLRKEFKDMETRLSDQIGGAIDAVEAQTVAIDKKFDVAEAQRRDNRLANLYTQKALQQILLDQTYSTIDAYQAKGERPPQRVMDRADNVKRSIDELDRDIRRLKGNLIQ